MGYTHYWNFNAPAKGETKRTEARYKQAVLACQRIAVYYNKQYQSGDAERLSGYAAHCKPGLYGGLKLNGRGKHAHEAFCLREHLKQNERGFCKTAGKHYDIVVVACLATMQHFMGSGFSVGSDGHAGDWVDGVELARKVTGRKVRMPAGIEPRGLYLTSGGA